MVVGGDVDHGAAIPLHGGSSMCTHTANQHTLCMMHPDKTFVDTDTLASRGWGRGLAPGIRLSRVYCDLYILS